MSQKPDPMVPAEVDLRGLEYMPLLGAKLFSSDFNLHASDAEFRRGLTLWWAAWNQVPAASLPDSDRALAKLAGFEDERSSGWRKVRTQALRGFVACSDGRLYHPVLARQALIAWERRSEDQTKRENEAERKRRERAERSTMFAQLRAVGVVPPFETKTADLRALVTQHVTASVTAPVTERVTGHVTPEVTPPVTRTDTAKTGRDGTGQGIHSVPDGTAAAAPPPASTEQGGTMTPRDRLWALGEAVLGPTEERWRPKVGKLVGTYGEEVVLASMQAAAAERPGQPYPWLVKACEARKNTPIRASGKAVAEDPLAGDPRPRWALDAGFDDRFVAENAGCRPGNAHQFRDGRRIIA